MPDKPTDKPTDLAAQLQESQLACRLAQEMARFQAGFLGRVAHELRSPLNRILGIHQIILADLCDSPEEEREFLRQSQAAAQTLLQLLSRVSDLSKLAYGTEKLNIQPLQVQAILQNLADRTSLQFANRNLRLQVAEVDPAWYILADPIVLLQVLVNLVETPIAHLTQGTLTLTTAITNPPNPASDSSQITITIAGPFTTTSWADPIGEAIPAEIAPQSIFNPDDKSPAPNLHQPPPHLWPSLGLSLTINQTLLGLMGGHLDIAETETSTRFVCALPLCPPEDDLD